MKYSLFTLFLLAAALILQGCNDKVFVDDESGGSASYKVASGDSVTVGGIKLSEHVAANMIFDEPTRIDIYSSENSSCPQFTDSAVNCYISSFTKGMRIELTCGTYRSVVRVNSNSSITFSASQSLQSVPVTAILELLYPYSMRILSFETLPFSGSLEVKKVAYGPYFIESDGLPHTVSYVFDNPSSSSEKEFIAEPFARAERRLQFAVDSQFASCPFAIDPGLEVPVPSLPMFEGQSGGIGFYGLTAPFKIGLQMLPSVNKARKFRIKVPPLTRRIVEFTMTPLVITNSVTLVCVNPISPESEIFIPGNMLAEDDSFYHTNVTDTPL